MEKYKPTKKITAGAIAGAVTVLIVAVLSRTTGIDVTPAESGAATLLLTLVAGWMRSE